jgi:glutamine amidotransferase
VCRHLAYLGPPRSLHALVYGPPHSLEHQSYAPRLNLHNVLNADGFGVGWYPAEAGEPVRFRRDRPIWTDESFRDISRAIEAPCALAAVRSATQGFPVEESCAQPLRCDRWLFSHNGKVNGFGGVEPKLRELAGDLSAVPEARAPMDSALLFAITVQAWRSGRSLGDGLAETVCTVAPLAEGRYNLLATDGVSLAATTWGDSLFTWTDGEAVAMASEPCDDDPAWAQVPDRSLVLTAPGKPATIKPLQPA